MNPDPLFVEEAVRKFNKHWRVVEDPDPLLVPEEVYRPVGPWLEQSRTVRAPWNREEGAPYLRTVPSQTVSQLGAVSRRSLYLAIGSGFLLGLGVGWMVRRA